MAPGTLLVVTVTGVVSLLGFAWRDIYERFLFSTERVLRWKEHYRIVTSGFLHADLIHLLFNMVSFYSFAETIEWRCGTLPMLVIYFSGMVGGDLLSLYLHRFHDYRALGASGGVCGIIFAAIFLLPGGGIVVFPLPIAIPSWLYAILFLLGSYVQLRRQEDNIGHDAHIGGAIIGLLAATAMFPDLIRRSLLLYLTVLTLSGALFWHLFKNPLCLPFDSLFDAAPNDDNHPRYSTAHLQEPREVDRILEKISQHGMDALTDQERRMLEQRSAKLRRRQGEG